MKMKNLTPQEATDMAADDEIARVLESYLTEVESGRPCDPERLLREHPAIAGRLRACLSSLHFLNHATVSLEAQTTLDLPAEETEGVTPRLGDFRVIRELGRGGMGIVYEAEQVSLDRRVALKVLPFAAVLDQKQIQRFKNEAHAAAQLHHNHIVPVFSVGCERGVHYYAMQYIDGQSLASVVRDLRELSGLKDEEEKDAGSGVSALSRQLASGEFAAKVDGSERPASRKPATPPSSRPPETSRALEGISSGATTKTPAFFKSMARLGVQAAQALDHAHEMGIVHRDVKPANFLLDTRGHLWITDFGLARCRTDASLTMSGDLLGTLRYMSPEQALAKRVTVDERTDIYSLGVTLYELLTLEPVFSGRDRQELLRKIAFEEPRPPRKLNRALPADLETIVLKAITKDPESRYTSAREMAEDLNRFLDDRPVLAKRPSVLERAAKWCGRRKKAVASAVAIFVLLAVTVGLCCKDYHEAQVALYREKVREGVLKLGGGQISGNLKAWEFTEVTPLHWSRQSDIFSCLTLANLDPARGALEVLSEAVDIFPGRLDAYYHRARGHLLRGENDEASRDIARALDCDRGFVPAWILRAVILGRSGEPREASAEIKRARENGADAWTTAWLDAYEAVADKRWKDAADSYGRLIRLGAGGEELYVGAATETRLGRGYALLKAKDFRGAIEEFSAAAALWPGAVEPVLALGRTYYMMGDKRRAEEKFESLLALGDHPDEVLLEIIQLHKEYFDFEKALKWARRIRSPYIRESSKVFLHSRLNQHEEAQEAARNVLALLEPDDPRIARAYGNLAFSYTHQGDYDRGMTWFRKALQNARRDDKFGLYFGHAFSLIHANRPREAEQAADEALKCDPFAAHAHHIRGAALRFQGKHEEAIAAQKRAIELRPGAWAFYQQIGFSYQAMGLNEVAIKWFRDGVRVNESNPIALARLGNAYRLNRQYKEALDVLEKAIALDEDRAYPYNELGALYLWGLGEPEEARGYLETAAKLVPSSWTHTTLGRIHDSAGRHEDAVDSYGKAIEVDPHFTGNRSDHGHVRRRLAHFLRQKEKSAALGQKLDAVFARLEEMHEAGQEHPLLLELLALGRVFLPERRDFPRALDFARRAVEETGRQDLDLLTTLAEVLSLRDERGEAVRVLEEALRLPRAKRHLEEKLRQHREAALPDLPTFASVDAALEPELEELVVEGAAWRLFRGKSEPSADLEWARPGFDDSSWELAPSGFGYGDLEGGTLLTDMQGLYSTVFLRHTFDVADPGRYERILLSVKVDDGFVAYLNGEEIGRALAGKRGERRPHDAFADGNALEPIAAVEISLETELLHPGANCLAVQGLNVSLGSSDFVLIPELKGELPRRAERDRGILERFREAGGDARLRIAYLEGRLLEDEGEHAEAAEKFLEVVTSRPPEPEPYARLAGSLRAAGKAATLEKELRRALEQNPSGPAELWELWVATCLRDLAWSPGEILGRFPRVSSGRHAEDLRWLLERLEEGGGIRINCGGEEYRAKDGKVWGRDRFYTGGTRFKELDRSPVLRFLGEIAGADDDPLYQTDRWYAENEAAPASYRIPVPEGLYHLTLHFAEIQKKGLRRMFDVLLERERVLTDHELEGFAVASRRSFDVMVTDGLLDIEFEWKVYRPEISAIEIRRAD